MKLKNKILLAGVSIALASVAHATDATFDSSTSTTSLSGGVVTAVAIVGPLVALSAGVMVWKKVKGFFNKAG